MNNFNRRSPHGSKRHANWRNNAHSRGSHAFTHTPTSTQLPPRCVKHQLSYYRIWNKTFILKVPEGGGANRSTRRKTPANRYHIILEETIQSPGRELNPHLPTLVISSLPGQEHTPRLTH